MKNRLFKEKIKMNQETLLYEQEVDAMVEAGFFNSKQEVLSEAVDTFLAINPQMRLDAAIEMFKKGKVTLARAAEIAGLNRWAFQTVLVQRGIEVIIECEPYRIMDKEAEDFFK